MGLQIGSPSRLTSTAAVGLKKITGGSAFRPLTFFGTIWLLSTEASTRSSAMTRSARGTFVTMSSTTARTWSRSSVGKLDSVILNSEKLTSRCGRATLVSTSSLSVPNAGFDAPFAAYEAAMYSTARFWSVQLATCGWYSTNTAPPGEVYVRGQPPSGSTGLAAAVWGAA